MKREGLTKYDEMVFLKNSSTIWNVVTFKSEIEFLLHNGKFYVYNCKSPRQAKIWFNRVQKADSIGAYSANAEFHKFKSLNLMWR